MPGLRRGCTIISGERRHPTIIYPEVEYEEDLETGHFVLIRGKVKIGKRCKIGSYSSVEGDVTIGNDVVIRGKCEIPSSIIGDRVQIYYNCAFYDTPNLFTMELKPPIIGDNVTLACDVRVLGGVKIGEGSFVCAGAFVTQDIPPYSYVKRDGSFCPNRF
jgi:acetyltransferase-like isoleucine patch superfamily enzyme